MITSSRTLLSAFALAAITAASALHGAAYAAGKAEVHWIEPQNFRDAGFGSLERERTLKSLATFIEKLGQRLPDGQTLKLEVTDLDMAGEVWPRSTREVRILRGGADWPHMSMRYSLLSPDGRVLKSGQAELSDMAYQFFTRPSNISDSDLPYEKRMIDRWFTEQLIKPAP